MSNENQVKMLVKVFGEAALSFTIDSHAAASLDSE
jgi:hypothetical protein